MISERQSSQTAMTAAAARAAHLIVDHPPVIFADTLAADLLGDRADEFISYHRLHGSHLVLSAARAQVTCRSRYTEDSLADAIGRGITQYVVLGAGLDSFAFRSPLADQVAVLEVDHPATQEWKRDRLSEAGLIVPANVSFVAVDFETVLAMGGDPPLCVPGGLPPEPPAGAGSLTQKLIGRGFDRTRPAFVSWLGVTMYLTEPAIGAVLGEVGRFAPGTELVLDYMLPAELRDEIGRSYVEQVALAAAERGEPWLTFFTPQEMSALLVQHGLGGIRHVAQGDIGGAAMWCRTDALRPANLSVLAHAIALLG